MRKLLLAFLLAALPTHAAITGPAKAIGTKDCNTLVTTCPISYTPNAAGNAAVATGTSIGTTVSVTGITDNGASGGSTWNCPVKSLFSGTNHIGFICYTCSLAASITTITVTTSSARTAFLVSEWAGVDHASTTSCLDTNTSSWANATSTTCASASLTPATAGELLVGSCQQTTNGGSAFTNGTNTTVTNLFESGDLDATALGYEIYAGTTGRTSTATIASIPWWAQAAFFKVASSGCTGMGALTLLGAGCT